MRWVDEMALGMERGHDRIRVLSDLSGDVVRALLGDDDDRRTSESDPFAAALQRYRNEGSPAELTGSWRRTIAPPPVRASESTGDVLRLLARDLLACVAEPEAGSAPPSDEPEPEPPPPNVRPIGSEIGIPALELGSDGSWRPSTVPGVASDGGDGSQRRNAHVPSLASRYPTVQAPGPHVFLPAPPVTANARRVPTPERPAASTPPERPAASTTPPEPARAPEPRASVPTPPPPATTPEDESVIRSVSAGIEIVAGPFDRFQHLAAFVKSLRGLRGVQDVTTRQFLRGMVHLRVRHSPGVDLPDALLTLTQFSPSIVSSTSSRIELRVEPSDDIPPAES